MCKINKSALLLVLFSILLLTACETSSTNQFPAKEYLLSKHVNQSLELKKITVSTNVDWNKKKNNLTKYIVIIENNSNKQFSGEITVTPSTSRISDSVDIDIPQLFPNEQRIFSYFADIKPETKFEYQISGEFFILPTYKKR